MTISGPAARKLTRALTRPLTQGQGGGFSLASLFRAGEDGFLFYPMSDLTRLFLLSTGSTGNAAVDSDPVGLDLDNHGWGASDLTATLAAQSELLVPGSWAPGTNGVGNTATNSPSGTLNLTNADGTAFGAYADQSFATVVGKTYKLLGTVAGATAVYRIGTAHNGNTVQADTSAPIGSFATYFVATSTTTWVRVHRSGVGAIVVSAISCKLAPGNHALQATTTKRPLYKTNGGKPYLAPDESDGGLVSPVIPAGNLTVDIAARLTKGAASTIMLGGGNSTGNLRAYIGIGADGVVLVGWGTSVFETSGPDRSGADMVVVVTGDGTGRDLWINGVQATIAAPSGAPNGTGGGMALGQFNNNGTPSSFASGNLYGALVLNRRVTPAEIAGITSLFQRTYQ